MNLSIAQFILPFFGGFLGVWWASRFAALRLHEDRVWQRKSIAYGVILEALEDMRGWYAVHRREVIESRDPSEELTKERDTQFHAAQRDLHGAIAREIWLLPDGVKAETDRLDASLAGRRGSWFEHVDECEFEVKITINNISGFARTDLKRLRLISWI